ncbi:MAG: hypothetical protein KA964_13520, partial [Comamonas sp.]|nr:hypothetical protein [Comamonas sp.]
SFSFTMLITSATVLAIRYLLEKRLKKVRGMQSRMRARAAVGLSSLGAVAPHTENHCHAPLDNHRVGAKKQSTPVELLIALFWCN